MRKVIEKRVYNTVHGPWTYATVDEFDSYSNVLMVGTLENFKSVRQKIGDDRVKDIYIECSDGEGFRGLYTGRREKKPQNTKKCADGS